MKKFLAVLLAVALLGVAGAAFAEDAGHDVGAGHNIPSSDSSVTINLSEFLKIVEDKHNNISSTDITGLSGKGTTKDISASDLKTLYSYYAGNNNCAVAAGGNLKIVVGTAAIDVLSIDVTFDETYKDTAVTAVLANPGAVGVTLADGATAKFTAKKVPATAPYTLTMRCENL